VEWGSVLSVASRSTANSIVAVVRRFVETGWTCAPIKGSQKAQGRSPKAQKNKETFYVRFVLLRFVNSDLDG
jgi:hypothetical protein